MNGQNRETWERSENRAGAPNGNVHATYGLTPHISHRRDIPHASGPQLLHDHGLPVGNTPDGVTTQSTFEKNDDHEEVLALQSEVLARIPKANISLLRHIGTCLVVQLFKPLGYMIMI